MPGTRPSERVPRAWIGPANFGVKLARPGFGPAAELPAASPAPRRHGGCSSPLGSLERHWRQPPRRSAVAARDRPCSLHQGRSMKAIVKGGSLLC
jgi:hypothetical protein